MRILVAWDDVGQAELLKLYLATGDNEAHVAESPDDVLTQTAHGGCDVLLLSLTYPHTADESFALFSKVQINAPGLPIVLACRQAEMLSLPRFLTHGLRFYLMRDNQGDFVFLVLSSLESAVAASRAEESRKLAERLREEMDGVRRLQESIIPKGLVPPPGYRVAARYEPSQVQVVGGLPVVMAGGDYYDLFRADDRTLIVIIGDASGHGLKACMSIMAMHTLIRMFTGEKYRNTADFVAEINNRLCENSIVQSGGGFITLFYAAIDTVTHQMTWTSAGHPLSLLQSLETGEVRQIGSEADGGLPLGITTGTEYVASAAAIPPSSRVLFYTDGLTDAFPLESKNYNAFGVKGIQESLLGCRCHLPEQALEQLFQAAHAFTGGTGRHDDTSAVLLERC
jgi:sigma-B regulation protein RsbU (phosphoserine phosphatase)